MNRKVCAVVVTYNRLTLLKECINSLMSQSYRNFDIVVVNNGSTDGTKDYIDSVEHVIPIHQDNLGGAGGFYAGMKYAYEQGYNAIWMMDDDGICDKDELKYLLEFSDKLHLMIANAMVVAIENHDRYFNGKKINPSTLKDEVILNRTSPFNGTLIYRAVVDKIGYVKKEMFIYGDEREYLARAKKAKLSCGTVIKAVHYHPMFKGDVKWIVPVLNVGRIYLKSPNFSNIYYRNLGYLFAEYRIMTWMKYALYYLTRLQFASFVTLMKSFNRGRKAVF